MGRPAKDASTRRIGAGPAGNMAPGSGREVARLRVGHVAQTALSLPEPGERRGNRRRGADIAGIRAANIGHFTHDRLTAILGKLGQEVELAVSVKLHYPFRRSPLPSRVIELFEVFLC